MHLHRSGLSNKEIGYLGEEATARHLERTGYVVYARNLRFSAGEIDIVALHKDTVCVIEVKAQVSINKEGRVTQ